MAEFSVLFLSASTECTQDLRITLLLLLMLLLLLLLLIADSFSQMDRKSVLYKDVNTQ
jgi:hypothetical protein